MLKDRPFSPLSQNALNKYSHITGRGWKGSSIMPVQPDKPAVPNVEPIVMPEPQEPGFYVVLKSTTLAGSPDQIPGVSNAY